MNNEDDGPPMLVSSDNVDDVDASLNAEMADAQIKKVPISIITGELISSLTYLVSDVAAELFTTVIALCIAHAGFRSQVSLGLRTPLRNSIARKACDEEPTHIRMMTWTIEPG